MNRVAILYNTKEVKTMDKLERFYIKLEKDGKGVTANNGDYGYFVTVGELIKNGGRDDFFRKVRKSDKRVSNNVYYCLEYDKAEKGYYADCYTNPTIHSGLLKKDTLVFIGFTF